MNAAPPLLLAFADTDLPAKVLAPWVGWLALIGLVALVASFIVQRERWRRFWFEREDPRTIGLFRIVFGVLVLLNMHGMWDQFEFLFTDEGMFSTPEARNFMARHQFAGYGEPGSGDPEGFFDLAAVMRFAAGPKWSALFFWDSPKAFWIHFWVFEILVWLFIFGVFSRVTGWLAYFATLSIMHRNAVFWTGADVVFKVFFLYLVMAKNGHAYSVDNWLRMRRARRAKGTKAPPIYRRIPAWPRRLMIIQLCIIYFWTGCAKTGRVWSSGDSLYYALNLDHFSRVPTSFMASVFGTNLFRLMTWVVHFWQIGFPLMLLGLVLRWAHRQPLELTPRQARWVRRLSWVTALCAVTIGVILVPAYHHPRAPLPRVAVQGLIAGLGVGAILLIDWAWPKIRAGHWSLSLGGRRIPVDVEFIGSWVLGRRIWLLLGSIFHLQILTLMNIGMFAPVMLGVYITCLNGGESAALLSGLGRAASRLLPKRARERVVPILRVEAPTPVPEGDATSRGVIGATASFAALAATVVSLLLAIWKVSGWWLPMTGAAFGLLALAWRSREAASRPDLAYGPLGRASVGIFLAAELCALVAWAVPDKAETASWRGPTRHAVMPLLRVTNTLQSWNMFAPNPPRSNDFLRVLVTDDQGEVWDMMTDANSPRLKETPWVWYSRAGKVTRRVMGKPGKAYRKHYARYWCRQWALSHDGQSPRKVELVRDSYRIPKPGSDPWRPEELLESKGAHVAFHSQRCRRVVDGQLSNEVRARHGLPEVDPTTLRTRKIRRFDRWQRRDEAKVKARTAKPAAQPTVPPKGAAPATGQSAATRGASPLQAQPSK